MTIVFESDVITSFMNDPSPRQIGQKVLIMSRIKTNEARRLFSSLSDHFEAIFNIVFSLE